MLATSTIANVRTRVKLTISNGEQRACHRARLDLSAFRRFRCACIGTPGDSHGPAPNISHRPADYASHTQNLSLNGDALSFVFIGLEGIGDGGSRTAVLSRPLWA